MDNNMNRKIKGVYMGLYKKLPLSGKRMINRVIHIGLRNRKMSFEIHLCEHCNLNCRGCDNYSPLAKEKFIEVDCFKKQLVQMAKIFGDTGIGEVRILGGEPLLHPDIIEILTIARRVLPKATITVITNGILLPKLGTQFYAACAQNSIHVMVTKYPIKIDYDSILKQMNSNGVVCGVFNSEPIKTLFKKPLDVKGEQDPKKEFELCMNANHCIFLRDGRLYTCSTIPNVHHFSEYFNIPMDVCEKDSIDIFEVDDKKKIRKFLSKPVPFCRFCDIEHEIFDIPWGISHKEESEWC